MKDVKTYINIVGQRLGKAFSLKDFDIENELEFWALSAEHMSRSKSPSFQDVVQWMDIIYKAPVHIVYKKIGSDLFLYKRSVNIFNLLGKNKTEELTELERNLINEFEQQVQNLQQKRIWYPDFNEHGVSSNSIGNCEHIPLFDENREVWGLYIVGPNSKCPSVILPRLSIVGRLLSNWLINIDKDEEFQKNNYRAKVENIVSELGTGALNANNLTRLFLRYLLNGYGYSSGAVIENVMASPKVVYQMGIDSKIIQSILSDLPKFTDDDKVYTSKNGTNNIIWIPIKTSESLSTILMIEETTSSKLEMEVINNKIAEQLAQLFDFRDYNQDFTESLLDSYYRMLRVVEKSREKTKYHTPRLLAFVEKFSVIFGLNESETKIVMAASKLHDIGYVGSLSVEPDFSMGSELTHPLTGYKLIDQLPIHEDIKSGVLTHHEWVNGSGTPNEFQDHEIPWTGKIVSIFEYIVEFIEDNVSDKSKSEDEWIDFLSQSIIERADIQFDMVLVPIVIELIKMMGWKLCCKLGTDV